ncbi:hypothetical protein K7I13_08805 [Brucepastera parasyntrophica]|uniref:hypothetical protein n=1 Tax=Brucepastera parasyntrophica TaxID=2880008 RepID=UPI00210B9291|nr:hypothetical protein [Brucepastera parasyntrophica]ULQ58658.1 hypothetical protein K7I13_08805 [Brucepastera parasyntrophica]
MTQYKTVAGPVGLTISNKETYADAVKQYASIIDKEVVGGWKLDCIQQIPVTQTAGCFSALFGKKAKLYILICLFLLKKTKFYFSQL